MPNGLKPAGLSQEENILWDILVSIEDLTSSISSISTIYTGAGTIATNADIALDGTRFRLTEASGGDTVTFLVDAIGSTSINMNVSDSTNTSSVTLNSTQNLIQFDDDGVISSLSFSETGIIFTNDVESGPGVEYAADYSSGYTNRSLADWGTIQAITNWQANTDTIFAFGRVKIGSTGANLAAFAHSNHFNSSSYALLQSVGGATVLNCKTGQSLQFAINNMLVGIWDASDFTFSDGVDLSFNTSTGTKIGTGSTQKIALWGATPVIQPTTGITAATFVSNTSTILNDTATWDSYTIGQVVAALRQIGILA